MPSLITSSAKAGKETLASVVYDQLRQDILTVAVPAGSKLNIRELCERFSVGLSPVREALSRLSMEKLVSQVDHRGFTVAPLSEADLDDLTRARCAIDGMALRQSMEAGEAAWEEQLLLSYHRLSRTPRFGAEGSPTRSPIWEEAHRNFHRALVAGCGSRWLETVSGQLFEAAERYRHLARRGGATRVNDDEHRPIMEAALAHEVDHAVDLLSRHYERTADLVKLVLRDPGATKTVVPK
ncbi:transcriptional regulator, GntR family [Faunimonas pinastri]|uniref:Transcriptional regulator, GntR family n=1 Tax=Faunimonas pinastri TaxID=1855383 RepID=A0A1H9E365_9HYPH|nr:FCD domain-containing protein [Faunimonas pinastri]SEQ20189.1 transcriptional regulator, GntR family [Faunimonas pinastri]